MNTASPCSICSDYTHPSSKCPSLRDMRGGGGSHDDEQDECIKKDVCFLSSSSFQAVKSLLNRLSGGEIPILQSKISIKPPFRR